MEAVRSEGLVVTEATPDDVDAVAGFFWAAWEEAGPDAPGWAGASEGVLRELTLPAAILARIGGPERRMFLAQREGRVLGFAATRRIDAGSVELAGIVVLAGAVGSGIGGRLMQAALASAATEGYERMIVKTEADNERALGFYESHGFRRAAAMTEDVEGVPIDLIELGLDLTAA
jgi:ribosomal protein S18 acetylase RimI-like enzyme